MTFKELSQRYRKALKLAPDGPGKVLISTVLPLVAQDLVPILPEQFRSNFEYCGPTGLFQDRAILRFIEDGSPLNDHDFESPDLGLYYALALCVNKKTGAFGAIDLGAYFPGLEEAKFGYMDAPVTWFPPTAPLAHLVTFLHPSPALNTRQMSHIADGDCIADL